MNEDDLRVKRTRRLLREAFFDLATEHGYENISVRDITNKAQVGYQTFYRHYEGKDGLLSTLATELVDDIQKLLATSVPSVDAFQANTIKALQIIKEHSRLMRILLKSPTADQFTQPLLQQGSRDAAKVFSNTGVPDELVGYFFVMNMMELVLWWLENDMVYPPAEMAAYMNTLIVDSLHNLSIKNQTNSE